MTNKNKSKIIRKTKVKSLSKKELLACYSALKTVYLVSYSIKDRAAIRALTNIVGAECGKEMLPKDYDYY